MFHLFCSARPLSHCFHGNVTIFSDNLSIDSPGFSTDAGIFNKTANLSALISSGFHCNYVQPVAGFSLQKKFFFEGTLVGKLALPPPPVISNRASLTDFVLLVGMLL